MKFKIDKMSARPLRSFSMYVPASTRMWALHVRPLFCEHKNKSTYWLGYGREIECRDCGELLDSKDFE